MSNKDETPIDAKTGKRLGSQLDIASLKTLKTAASTAGTLHRDNFPNTPKGQERFERALRNIGREQLPKTPEGHAGYPKEFFACNGMVNNTIYNVLRIYNQKPDETLLHALIEVAHKSSTENGFGYNDDGGIARFVDISNKAMGYHCSDKEAPQYQAELMDSMIIWSVLHRVMVHVDPVTSELLANTEPPTSQIFDPLDFVKKWPVAVLHDSRPVGANGTGITYLVTGAFDSTRTDVNSTESILDVEWQGIIVWAFGLSPHSEHSEMSFTMFKIKAGQDMSSASDEVKWLCNAYALATSFPTYIKAPLESKRQNAAFGKRAFEPSIRGNVLTANIQSRTLNQIITEQHQNSESSAGGWTVKPHWRVGHWKKVHHGVRWEIDNPDKTVYEDDLDRRYHMSYIMPTLVNQDKFLGDPGKPD